MFFLDYKYCHKNKKLFDKHDITYIVTQINIYRKLTYI
jgi:hypothetical protein